MPRDFHIDVTKGLKSLRKDFDDFTKKQIPYAQMLAANEIGAAVMADIKAGMQKDFDRPVSWTLNAFYFRRASKSNPVAFIGIREFAAKGTPAWKYLLPETDGGGRRLKRFERALGSLSGNKYTVPTTSTPTDEYGNINRGLITKMLSQLNAFPEVGYRANMSDKTRARLERQGKIAKFGSRKIIGRTAKGEPIYAAADRRRSAGAQFFVGNDKKTGAPIGIYQLISRGNVKPILLFKDGSPKYTPKFNFDDVVARSISKHQVGAFDRALATAMKTAR